jgi:hypothetical protein
MAESHIDPFLEEIRAKKTPTRLLLIGFQSAIEEDMDPTTIERTRMAISIYQRRYDLLLEIDKLVTELQAHEHFPADPRVRFPRKDYDNFIRLSDSLVAASKQIDVEEPLAKNIKENPLKGPVEDKD